MPEEIGIEDDSTKMTEYEIDFRFRPENFEDYKVFLPRRQRNKTFKINLSLFCDNTMKDISKLIIDSLYFIGDSNEVYNPYMSNNLFPIIIESDKYYKNSVTSFWYEIKENVILDYENFDLLINYRIIYKNEQEYKLFRKYHYTISKKRRYTPLIGD